MTRPIVCLLLSGLAFAADADEQFSLSLEQWERPRQGAALVRYPTLNAAVQAWRALPHGQLQIRYPGGEEGSLMAYELRDWFVALGIPSSRIDTFPGSAQGEALDLIIHPLTR